VDFPGIHRPAPASAGDGSIHIDDRCIFTPLRRRIQNDNDQRFYRRKYDAKKMLRAFSLTVRNEVELEKLTERMLAVVEEAMEPQSLSLWISKLYYH
jgi:hypothetical protein